MLNAQEINDWYERLDVLPDSRKFTERIRPSEPTRRLKSGKFKSERVEFPGVYTAHRASRAYPTYLLDLELVDSYTGENLGRPSFDLRDTNIRTKG